MRLPSSEFDAPRRCVFTSGGTGGHLFPALAVAAELHRLQPPFSIRFLGSDRPQERELIAKAGYRHDSLPGIAGQRLRHPWRFTSSLISACRQARTRLQAERPDVVVGCGGLSSLPTILAARREGIPIVLLEQNVLPGRTTRWISRWASTVCVSFAESRAWLPRAANCEVTGNPVRREISLRAGQAGGPQGGRPLLLVLGGSLGSQAINSGVLKGLSASPDRWTEWQIVHQTGLDDLDRVSGQYRQMGIAPRVEAFLHDIPQLLAQATIVVCRAGATTLAELACTGTAAVVVPWRGARDDHQSLNARWYADRGAVLPGDEAGFFDQVQQLAESPTLRDALARSLLPLAGPDAAVRVASIIAATARSSR